VLFAALYVIFVTYGYLYSLSSMAGDQPPTPDLLDPYIDATHRSFLATVERRELGTLRPRPPQEVLDVDPRWVVR
jgi:hypothetical protein